MDQNATLRHADITDVMTCLGDGATVRITGLYKIEKGQSSRSHGSPINYLRTCLADDPDLTVIETYAASTRFHHPWDLEWSGPVAWTVEHIETDRAAWRLDVERFSRLSAVRSTQCPQLFERFPLLTNHERMRLADWRRETDNRIRAYEAELERRMGRDR